MQIAPLLSIEPGVTAVIGGGGKTTLLYTLAEELRPLGSVIVCTSTKIRAPEQYPVLTDGDEDALRASLLSRGVVCAGTPIPDGKLTAPALSFSALAALSDYVLVEADGAKGLPLKAHAGHEPVIPENTRRTILVMGADGFGMPVRTVCHRPALYAERAGAQEDDIVTPALAARVLLAEGLGDLVFVNKTENTPAEKAAQELSALLSCPVAAGSLRRRIYRCLS